MAKPITPLFRNPFDGKLDGRTKPNAEIIDFTERYLGMDNLELTEGEKLAIVALQRR